MFEKKEIRKMRKILCFMAKYLQKDYRILFGYGSVAVQSGDDVNYYIKLLHRYHLTSYSAIDQYNKLAIKRPYLGLPVRGSGAYAEADAMLDAIYNSACIGKGNFGLLASTCLRFLSVKAEVQSTKDSARAYWKKLRWEHFGVSLDAH